MTQTQLANVPAPPDAIETLDWASCPCDECDTPTRVFITYRDGVAADDGDLIVELTGVQEPDDAYRRGEAAIRICSQLAGDMGPLLLLAEDELREAAAAFIAAADKLAAQ